jgi:arginase
MTNLHFFKAHCRLGLINAPIHSSEQNLGVEFGSDLLLNEDFLNQFPNFEVSEFDFPSPEIIVKDHFLETLVQSLSNFRAFIHSSLKVNQIQVVIGGDHSITLPSVLAVLERVDDPKKLGYIHFDSHGDINLQKDSPTNNFHGMYLRPLFDTFDVPEIDALVPKKIPAENALFIGNFDLDPAEKEFMDSRQFWTISKSQIVSNLDQITEFVKKFEYIHVSFDVDSLDQSIFPATGIPAKNGLVVDNVLPILEIIKTHPKFSFDLAEFNPKKDGADQSKKIAQQILLSVLKK